MKKLLTTIHNYVIRIAVVLSARIVVDKVETRSTGGNRIRVPTCQHGDKENW
jgi:hypothetical protein